MLRRASGQGQCQTPDRPAHSAGAAPASLPARPCSRGVTEVVMLQQPQGNGSGKFNIHQIDMGGWVRVFTDEGAALPADLPVYLSRALADWFRQRLHLRMRCV